MGVLDGKVALITGGARGQGAAEARRFVDAGATVVVTDILDDDGAALAAELGDRAGYRHHDVTVEAEWADVVAGVLDEHGQIDVLVNNAGIFKVVPMLLTTEAQYRQVIDINQIGVFLGMKAVAPSMIDRKTGSIINVSSVAGLRGAAMTIAYASSKWAVRGMTKVASSELAPFGVRVNSVHPGLVDTPMLQEVSQFGPDVLELMLQRVPIGRLATADDVAGLVLFLAGDDSGYCTGAEFVVDGGMTA